MPRIRPVVLACLCLLMLGVVTSPPVASAQPAIGVHHLPTNAQNPVFAFGIRGGFPAGGPYKAAVFADGHMTMTKPTGGKFRFQDPKLRLLADGLRGLLKLAEAEGFFGLPSKITGTDTNPDMSAIFITITTAEGKKSVSVLGKTVPSFNELFDVLVYTTGVTR